MLILALVAGLADLVPILQEHRPTSEMQQQHLQHLETARWVQTPHKGEVIHRNNEWISVTDGCMM